MLSNYCIRIADRGWHNGSSTFNWLPLLAALISPDPYPACGIGELVVEKAGVLNLGVEGMMITGAVCGLLQIATESAVIGLYRLRGAALALLGVLTQARVKISGHRPAPLCSPGRRPLGQPSW